MEGWKVGRLEGQSAGTLVLSSPLQKALASVLAGAFCLTIESANSRPMTLALTSRESELAQQVTAALQAHFTIYQQVRGTHPTGKRLRIDAIAVPHYREQWSRPDIALGIEFKAPANRPEQKRERKDNAKIISQCIDYSLVDWDGFGKLPIFFCPGFTEIRLLEDRDSFNATANYSDGFKHGVGYMMAAVMGQNNVGELLHTSSTGWTFVINGHHRIWLERSLYGSGGVHEGSYNKLLRKVGSR